MPILPRDDRPGLRIALLPIAVGLLLFALSLALRGDGFAFVPVIFVLPIFAVWRWERHPRRRPPAQDAGAEDDRGDGPRIIY